MKTRSNAWSLCVVLALLGVSSVASTVKADTIGYWRFEEGTADTEIVTAVSEVDTSTMNATQWISNEVAVMYSSDVGGAYVYDPVTGTYTANTLSMISSAGTATSDDSQLITSGTQSITGDDWTFEMFIKTPTSVGSSATRIANIDGTERWNLNIGGNYVQFRVDTSALTDDVSQVYEYGDPTEDGLWHHIACTLSYDSTTNLTTIELFIDYVSVGTATATGQFDLTGDLRFGRDSGADGDEDWLFDEVRLSSGILTTDQFLQLTDVPEPCTAMLLGIGAAAQLIPRRR